MILHDTTRLSPLAPQRSADVSTLFGCGAGEGLGVHICTGPVAVKGAAPGDILEVRIIDVKPRPCVNPQYKGKSFGGITQVVDGNRGVHAIVKKSLFAGEV